MDSGVIAHTLSMGVSGVNGFPVHVEVFGIGGIPGMEIIGLTDTSVRESRDRVSAAIINSGRKMKPRKITVNLAPADMKKEGPSSDGDQRKGMWYTECDPAQTKCERSRMY